MHWKFFYATGIAILCGSCASFITNTTATELNKPATGTIDTRLAREQIGGDAGNNINVYMSKLSAQIPHSDHVKLTPYPEGFRIILDSQVLFDTESHTLKESPEYAKLFATLIQSEYAGFLLEVHTDGLGTRYYNQSLSERRAESIKGMLAKMGFPMERLTIKAYGEDQPVADNSFEGGQRLNRRIEIAAFATDALKEKAKKGPVQ